MDIGIGQCVSILTLCCTLLHSERNIFTHTCLPARMGTKCFFKSSEMRKRWRRKWVQMIAITVLFCCCILIATQFTPDSMNEPLCVMRDAEQIYSTWPGYCTHTFLFLLLLLLIFFFFFFLFSDQTERCTVHSLNSQLVSFTTSIF